MLHDDISELSIPYGTSGTATLVKYKGKLYVLTTRHQLNIGKGEKPNPEYLSNIFVPSTQGTLTNIPISECRFETSSLDEDYHDILFFSVKCGWEKEKVESFRFFEIGDFSDLPRIKSLAVGFPINGPDFIDYEKNEINFANLTMSCDLNSDFKTNSKHLIKYTYDSDFDNLNGFSGGAIFSLIGEIGSTEMVFDGIIIRGGNGNIYAIDADYIRKFLDKAKIAE